MRARVLPVRARVRVACWARGVAAALSAFCARVWAKRAQVSIWPLFRHTGCAGTIVKRSVLNKSERLAMVPAHPCVQNHGETVTFVQICETVVTFWRRRGGPVVTPGTRASKNGLGNEGIHAQTGVFLFGRETRAGNGRAMVGRGRGDGRARFPPKTEPLQLARLFILN